MREDEQRPDETTVEYYERRIRGLPPWEPYNREYLGIVAHYTRSGKSLVLRFEDAALYLPGPRVRSNCIRRKTALWSASNLHDALRFVNRYRAPSAESVAETLLKLLEEPIRSMVERRMQELAVKVLERQ